MNTHEIARTRLFSQQIARKKLRAPGELLGWMGAIQAQDFPLAKWAVGLRLPDASEGSIDAAINEGEILRTHLLRPTWHFVAAEDTYWLLDLTREQVMTSQHSRERQLELTEAVYTKSNSIIEKALVQEGELTREALMSRLEAEGIVTSENRSAHLLMRAELEQIICSGRIQRGKPTYALLANRVGKRIHFNHDEALAELTTRFFTSRCPATQQDFAWWSGLPAAEIRQAMDLVRHDFSSEEIDGKTYWFTNDFPADIPTTAEAFFLPTYDEFLISYTDRSASLPIELEHHLKQVSDRGMFRPIIVLDGQVVGIWKRTLTKAAVLVEFELFDEVDNAKLKQIQQAAARYGRFLGIETHVDMANKLGG